MDNLLAPLTALGGLPGLAGLVTTPGAARKAVKQSALQALRDALAAHEAKDIRLSTRRHSLPSQLGHIHVVTPRLHRPIRPLDSAPKPCDNSPVAGRGAAPPRAGAGPEGSAKGGRRARTADPAERRSSAAQVYGRFLRAGHRALGRRRTT